jgi:peptidoglycan-N-acetylglucosamine deacetylase
VEAGNMHGKRRAIWAAIPLLVLAFIVGAGPVAATTVASNGSRYYHRIALTFDDGYSAYATSSILGILRKYGVKATFFPTSDAVRWNPPVWRRVAAAGYPIGNHSINHPDLTRLSWSSVYHQITASRSVIQNVTGYRQIAYMRPPYGDYNGTVLSAASAAGYRKLVLWDVDSRDWTRPSLSTLIYNATRGRNGSIVLMHTLSNTVTALPYIIRNYKARGFTFVTVPQMLG